MRVIDPGHTYELDNLDGPGKTILSFVKREGEGFPGNVGHHEGTNMQEVIRALINRVKYLQDQIPSHANVTVLFHLRQCLWELELRAAQRHSRELKLVADVMIEHQAVCAQCGHIGCFGSGCKR